MRQNWHCLSKDTCKYHKITKIAKTRLLKSLRLLRSLRLQRSPRPLISLNLLSDLAQDLSYLVLAILVTLWYLHRCPLSNTQLEVVTDPPMDLPVSKLIQSYRLAWRSSNKKASLSFNRRWSGSLQVPSLQCHANGWGLASWLNTLHFHSSDCLHIHFSSWDHFFFAFLKTLQAFASRVRFRGLSLG